MLRCSNKDDFTFFGDADETLFAFLGDGVTFFIFGDDNDLDFDVFPCDNAIGFVSALLLGVLALVLLRFLLFGDDVGLGVLSVFLLRFVFTDALVRADSTTSRIHFFVRLASSKKMSSSITSNGICSPIIAFAPCGLIAFFNEMLVLTQIYTFKDILE